MKIDEYERLMKAEVTDAQRIASAYLESIGSRFCKEHGLINCESMALEAMCLQGQIDDL